MNERDFINIDIENIKPVEMSKREMKNIEKNILRPKKLQSMKYVKWLSAVAMVIIIVTSSSKWLPVVANRLPIVQQLLHMNTNPQVQVFSEYAMIINQIDESNGSSIELAEAFFDGSTISISYELKHDARLHESPLFWEGLLEVNQNKVETLSHEIIRKDDTTWIGMFTANVPEKLFGEKISVRWSPKIFKGIDNIALIQGDWDYQLELTPTQFYSKKIDVLFDNEKYQLKFNKITVGKYVTKLHFEGNLDWATEFLMVDIEDNLGNMYEDVTITTQQQEAGNVSGYIELFVPNTAVHTLMITPTVRIVDEKTLGKKKLIPLQMRKILLN